MRHWVRLLLLLFPAPACDRPLRLRGQLASRRLENKRRCLAQDFDVEMIRNRRTAESRICTSLPPSQEARGNAPLAVISEGQDHKGWLANRICTSYNHRAIMPSSKQVLDTVLHKTRTRTKSRRTMRLLPGEPEDIEDHVTST